MNLSYTLLLLVAVAIYQAETAPVLDPSVKVSAMVKSDPSPTLLQWASQFWSGYQQASSVLTPFENDTWLATSILDTFIGTRSRREEAEIGPQPDPSRVKRFLLPLLPEIIASLLGFKPGKEKAVEQLIQAAEKDNEDSNATVGRQKRMASLWIPMTLVDQIKEWLTTPLLGNQTLMFPVMVSGSNNTSLLQEQNQTQGLLDRPSRRSNKSPDWNPVDIVFAIVGAIGLVGTIVGAIGLAIQAYRDPRLLRQKSESTSALLTDDALTSGILNEKNFPKDEKPSAWRF